MKILMVCLGNICRSPLAQGILEKYVALNELNYEVDSCGTGSWHIGESPDKRSIAVAKNNGIDISMQKGRQFSKNDLEEYDLLLAMDTSNYRNIIAMATPGQKQKVKLIMNYLYPNENRVVPDPYYDGGFDHVYEVLDQACQNVIVALNANKKINFPTLE